MTTFNADNRLQYPSKISRAVAPRSPSSVAHAFNSTALSASSTTRASPSSPGSSLAAPVVVDGEASRCVVHFFEPLLGALDAPTREKFKRSLTTVAMSERT